MKLIKTSETTATGKKETKLEQILLNGNNITMVLILFVLKKITIDDAKL